MMVPSGSIAARVAKSQQVAMGKPFKRGEALKVLHPSALHCEIQENHDDTQSVS